jgi:hypothetical protein
MNAEIIIAVIPAKAGIQCLSNKLRWIPGSIADETGNGPGMTKQIVSRRRVSGLS